MKKSISLVAALALSSSVAFAGYGTNAGYSSTKKINIENQQWVLVGYPGGGVVSASVSTGKVAAQDAVGSSSPRTGDIYSPDNWNYKEATDDSNSSMTVGEGLEDNATFTLNTLTEYWSQLLAHSDFSLANIGEPAVQFIQNSEFMNLASGAANGIDGSNVMEIKLDGLDTTTNPILKINFNSNYDGQTFSLYLDANESNNTVYSMVLQSGTSYILNDPTSGTLRPDTNQLIEFNTSFDGNGAIGQVANDANISFGVGDLNDYIGKADIGRESNYTVAKFNSVGQSWSVYEANLTADTVISDNNFVDASGNSNRVTKGEAYWYKLNLASTLDLNNSITVSDETVGINDITLTDDSWNLVALPKGHIKHSQGGIIVTAGAGTYINFKGTVGDIEDTSINPIELVDAEAVNNFIDANGTLFEVPIRAYNMNADSEILIISDTQLDFNLSNGVTTQTIAGSYIGNSGKTKLGESAIAIKMNDGFFNRVEAGTFTIEIPGLFSGFTGVDVNITGIGGMTLLNGLAAMKLNIIDAMYNQACLHFGGDYNITTFDSDFTDRVTPDDSLLIALKAKGDRNITADTTNPTVCTNNGITRSGYNDLYLRIGVRENTYVTPYLMKRDGNATVVNVIDSSDNIYAKGFIATSAMSVDTQVDIVDFTNFIGFTSGDNSNPALFSDDLNGTYKYGSYVDWNFTKGVGGDPANIGDDYYDNNYSYFITSSRTLRLAESNVTDYNLSGASKYSILTEMGANDVLIDAHYLTSTVRKASDWVTNSTDVNATFLKGLISNVFTLADLAQAPLNSGGDLSAATAGVAGYSSSTDLNINTVWSVDMPTSGPLYDMVTKLGKAPSRILTFRNGSYVSIDISRTANTSEWFDSENLFFISAFNGYWVRANSNMPTYTINTATSADSLEKVIKTTYDMDYGTTTNYVFNKWIIDNIGTTSSDASTIFSTSMHNISIGDSNMSAQFTSVSGGVDRYEILIDPFTFPDFLETGFGATTKSIVITNGFESSTVGSPITYTYTKPSAPTVSGTANNDLTVSAVDTTLEVHLSYVDEANLSFTRLYSQTDTAVTVRPQDINVSSHLIEGTYSAIGSEINETKIRLFNVGADGLSSDVTTVIYPLFNVLLINPTTSGADYNLSLATSSDLNQTEWIDADGDGSGSKETQVVYNIISDDGLDNDANAIPSRYDINGTLISIATTHPDFAGGSATDGVQILSKTGSKVSVSYRPNGATSSSLAVATDYKNMDIYDGTSGVTKYIASVGFRSNTNNYDYNGTKWYLYSVDTSKMYVGIFETNTSGSNMFVDCSDDATNCTILNTTRTISE